MHKHVRKFTVWDRKSAYAVKRKIDDFLYEKRSIESYQGKRLEEDIRSDLPYFAQWVSEHEEIDWLSLARSLERIARMARKLALTQTEIHLTLDERWLQQKSTEPVAKELLELVEGTPSQGH